MILLALPGSTDIYQGDELGLHEVADLPPEALEDPMASPSTTEKGRDGCRVPLPWSADGPSYGFGAQAAHCPNRTGSGLTRLAFRRLIDTPRSISTGARSPFGGRLFAGNDFGWVDSEPSVLHFACGDGVRCVTNFGADPASLPPGEVILSSAPLADGRLPSDATVWLRTG
jgi:alpha-glucosidase